MILRLRSTKLGRIRFVGHLDLGRVWARALRRCEVPVAVTRGFTPRPRISFGLALPLGAESRAEYLDIELVPDASVDLPSLREALSERLPEGIDITAAACLEPPVGSLQESVTACTWELWAPGLDHAEVDRAIGLLDDSSLPLERVRKGRLQVDDVRPAINDLRRAGNQPRLIAELDTTGRSLRPAELARLAFPARDPLDVRVLRTHQWIDHDGSRREVLSLSDPVGAPIDRIGA